MSAKQNNGDNHQVEKRALLRKIGSHIHRRLGELGKTNEWLSFQSGIARSTIFEIIAGRSNARILTLYMISDALGYSSLLAFLSAALRE